MMKEFYYKPTYESSMGDKGIAMKSNPKFDGDGEQNMKFEGMAPERTASAREAQDTGRQ
jgi:hypothetical protein